MTPEAHPAPDLAAVDELRFLADALRRVEVATAAAHWDDDALAGVLADARADAAHRLRRQVQPRTGCSPHPVAGAGDLPQG